jgi:hypothetical protein
LAGSVSFTAASKNSAKVVGGLIPFSANQSVR